MGLTFVITFFFYFNVGSYIQVQNFGVMFYNYYKMFVQFTSPCSLDQLIHYFPTNSYLLKAMNSFKI